mmetsp:Transcript_41611/g.75466  ORF Transcript_41611/g.75466 Transcript_41611/m.75466 type:complete len:1170 (+) Transcript_41611:58-3567(+)
MVQDEALVELKTEEGKTYFWNRRDNSRAWVLPEGVAVKWVGQKTQDGRTYYWSRGTKETVWVLPPLPEQADEGERAEGKTPETALQDEQQAPSNVPPLPVAPAPPLPILASPEPPEDSAQRLDNSAGMEGLGAAVVQQAPEATLPPAPQGPPAPTVSEVVALEVQPVQPVAAAPPQPQAPPAPPVPALQTMPQATVALAGCPVMPPQVQFAGLPQMGMLPGLIPGMPFPGVPGLDMLSAMGGLGMMPGMMPGMLPTIPGMPVGVQMPVAAQLQGMVAAPPAVEVATLATAPLASKDASCGLLNGVQAGVAAQEEEEEEPEEEEPKTFSAETEEIKDLETPGPLGDSASAVAARHLIEKSGCDSWFHQLPNGEWEEVVRFWPPLPDIELPRLKLPRKGKRRMKDAFAVKPVLQRYHAHSEMVRSLLMAQYRTDTGFSATKFPCPTASQWCFWTQEGRQLITERQLLLDRGSPEAPANQEVIRRSPPQSDKYRLIRPALRTQISMVFKSPLLRKLELATRGGDKATTQSLLDLLSKSEVPWKLSADANKLVSQAEQPPLTLLENMVIPTKAKSTAPVPPDGPPVFVKGASATPPPQAPLQMGTPDVQGSLVCKQPAFVKAPMQGQPCVPPPPQAPGMQMAPGPVQSSFICKQPPPQGMPAGFQPHEMPMPQPGVSHEGAAVGGAIPFKAKAPPPGTAPDAPLQAPPPFCKAGGPPLTQDVAAVPGMEPPGEVVETAAASASTVPAAKDTPAGEPVDEAAPWAARKRRRARASEPPATGKDVSSAMAADTPGSKGHAASSASAAVEWVPVEEPELENKHTPATGSTARAGNTDKAAADKIFAAAERAAAAGSEALVGRLQRKVIVSNIASPAKATEIGEFFTGAIFSATGHLLAAQWQSGEASKVVVEVELSSSANGTVAEVTLAKPTAATVAVALNGIQFKGKGLEIKRPKGFVGEPLKRSQLQSISIKDLVGSDDALSTKSPANGRAASAGKASSNGTATVALTGIPASMTEQSVFDLLQQFGGPLRRLTLAGTTVSGSHEGRGTAEYIEAKSAEEAVRFSPLLGFIEVELADSEAPAAKRARRSRFDEAEADDLGPFEAAFVSPGGRQAESGLDLGPFEAVLPHGHGADEAALDLGPFEAVLPTGDEKDSGSGDAGEDLGPFTAVLHGL